MFGKSAHTVHSENHARGSRFIVLSCGLVQVSFNNLLRGHSGLHSVSEAALNHLYCRIYASVNRVNIGSNNGLSPGCETSKVKCSYIYSNQEPITQEHASTIGVCDNCPPLKEVINSPWPQLDRDQEAWVGGDTWHQSGALSKGQRGVMQGSVSCRMCFPEI